MLYVLLELKKEDLRTHQNQIPSLINLKSYKQIIQ